MKEFPESIGRWLDVAEIIIFALVAIGLCVSVYFIIYFAAILMEGAQ